MEIKINIKCLGKGEVNAEISCNADEAAMVKELLSEQLKFENLGKCNDTKKSTDKKSTDKKNEKDM